MKTPLYLAIALFPICAWAQTPSEIDYAARIESIENLKQHITQRDARFEALRQDLRTLDARVETQIDQIVKSLSSVKDSNDSKTRVAKIKGDAIQALVRNIGVYRQKRMEVFERMRTDPDSPKELLDRELAVFDERVGKRISQIMEISRSFPGHQDVQKYESEGTSYWNGWVTENTRISEDWKQNRRDARSDDKLRNELMQAIDKALATNQSRRSAIATKLASNQLSATELTAQQEELGRIDASIDNLRLQKTELALPTVGATREVSLNEAHDAEQLLDDARADLSRDMGDILRKFAELDREGTKIHAMKENLKAREEWLKNNPPPNK